jgi:hypothetical protein
MTTEALDLPSCDDSHPRTRTKPSVVLVSRPMGTVWFGGWLFTISFAHLVWWKALLAVVLWPYFLGLALR